MPQGGSMGPRYILLLEWKITKLLITQQPLTLEKKKHRFGIPKVLDKIDVRLAKFENKQILQIKLSFLNVNARTNKIV